MKNVALILALAASLTAEPAVACSSYSQAQHREMRRRWAEIRSSARQVAGTYRSVEYHEDTDTETGEIFDRRGRIRARIWVFAARSIICPSLRTTPENGANGLFYVNWRTDEFIHFEPRDAQ